MQAPTGIFDILPVAVVVLDPTSGKLRDTIIGTEKIDSFPIRISKSRPVEPPA